MQLSIAQIVNRLLSLESAVVTNNGEVWHKLSYNGNIVNQSGNQPGGYQMRSDGVTVDISGIVNSNPTPGTSTITTSTTIFTLPVGYRPTNGIAICATCFALNNGGYIMVGNNGAGVYNGPTCTALVFAGAIPLVAPV